MVVKKMSTGIRKELDIEGNEVIVQGVYYYAVPLSLENSNKWVMFGGNFITTSDSRFGFSHPIPVHDRVEEYR